VRSYRVRAFLRGRRIDVRPDYLDMNAIRDTLEYVDERWFRRAGNLIPFHCSDFMHFQCRADAIVVPRP
jgi:hypothetical protein